MGKGKSKKGFASMDKVKQKLIASRGGKTAHKMEKAHQFTREEAIAGKKDGQAKGKRK